MTAQPLATPMDWQGYQAPPGVVAGDQNFVSRSTTSIELLTADAICSANLSVEGDRQSPAALLVERNEQTLRILALGSLNDVRAHPATDRARRTDRPACILLPALVNAHTHLDLTHIGPQPHDPGVGFVPWIDMVRARRHTDPARIRDSVREGCQLLRKGGVGIVGDIAGAAGGSPTLEPWQALAESGLTGVSYIEFFAIGTRAHASIARLEALIESQAALTRGSIRLGLQPHAPNTVAPAGYDAARRLAQRHGLPLMTHLGESPEERRFIADCDGPQLDLLRSLGIWSEESAGDFGKGLSPVEHLEPYIRKYGLRGVHLNQCSDADLGSLSSARASVVYCPRASAYFGAETHFGPHRYREMLGAGVVVALGTDSVINLPSGVVDEAGCGLSPLDEARFLYERDTIDPDLLVRMMTTHGCHVLGLDDRLARLDEGCEPTGIIAVAAPGAGSGAKRVMESRSAPEFLFDKN